MRFFHKKKSEETKVVEEKKPSKLSVFASTHPIIYNIILSLCLCFFCRSTFQAFGDIGSAFRGKASGSFPI